MMKILTLLLLAGCLQLSAKTAAQGITLSLNNAILSTAFNEIQQQTPYRFVYTNEQLAGASKITVSVQNETIEKVLDICFRDQPLTYSIEDKFVIVRPKDRKVDPSPSFANDIKGKVLNEKDEPIAGASVNIKGTKRGVPTDDRGEFVLTDVPAGSVIVISSIGFEQREMIIGNNRYLAIHLQRLASGLDEMVIKGYYSTTKRLNTGSVSTITSEEITKQPITNVLSALEAQAPGVYIQQTTGMPGGAFNVLIRGQNSLRNLSFDNGNLPLYLVDGVPYPPASISSGLNTDNLQGGSPLNALNPSDIESISILKDADATAIYGSRGSNGVILITTKKGKPGKLRLDINAYSGGCNIMRRMHLLNTPEYLEMRIEALKNDAQWPLPSYLNYILPDVFAWDTTRFTDWQKTLIGGTAHITDVQSAISGGNDIVQFLMGGNYHRESTVLPGNFADQKASLHSTISYGSVNKKFTGNLSATFLADNNNEPPLDLTRTAIRLAPDAPALYKEDGQLNWEDNTWENPLTYIKQHYKANTSNLVSNMNLNYKVFNNLDIKSSFGLSKMWVKEISTIPINAQNPDYIPVQGSAQFGNSSTGTWIIEPQINYHQIFNKSKITVLAGATIQQNEQEAQLVQGTGFINDEVLNNIQAANSIYVLSSTQITYKYAAVFTRINYNWNDKYILNLTGRRDGSSRFGPGKQFANFGAIGAAWVFSSENFATKLFPFLTLGKLRGSYGTAGSDQIQDYMYLDSYSTTSYPYQTTGLIPSRLSNPDYAWEINKKFELSLELGLVNDRFFITSSYYRNRSSSQLVGYPLSLVSGFSSVQYNLPATVQNMGWEIDFKSTLIRHHQLSWIANLNLTFPRNKLISYPNISSSSYANTYTVGKSLTTKKLYHYTGVNAKTGTFSFLDVDGTGTISTPQDLTTFKNISQNYYGGLLNIIKFKEFQLDLLLQFVKQSGYNYLRGAATAGELSNQPDLVLNRWRSPNDQTDVQKFTLFYGSAIIAGSNARQSDKIISDASFIRLKNISLSYTIPHQKTFRVFLHAQNLITITHFLGMDPENQNADVLPPLRMLTAGVQITL